MAYDETQGKSFAIAHTLACVYAATGKPREARDLLLKGMEMVGIDRPDDSAWYGFGLVAEAYGDTESARDYYAQVEKPKKGMIQASSVYALSQARLTALRSEWGHSSFPSKRGRTSMSRRGMGNYSRVERNARSGVADQVKGRTARSMRYQWPTNMNALEIARLCPRAPRRSRMRRAEAALPRTPRELAVRLIESDRFDERLFAQRLLALHANALRPLAREVALHVPVDQRRSPPSRSARRATPAPCPCAHPRRRPACRDRRRRDRRRPLRPRAHSMSS